MPQVSCPFQFPPLQCLLSWTTCWLGCALTCYYVSITKHMYRSNSYLKPWLLSSQNLKNLNSYLKLLHLNLLKPTSPTTTEALTPEELELIRQHRATTREPSLAKKPRTDQGWEEFLTDLTALSAKDVELSDSGFGLQLELRSSPQARADFLAFNLTSPEALHFDPDKGKLQKIDLTFNRSKLQRLRFKNSTPIPVTILEQYNTHIQIDTVDTRLKTVESTIDSKALLLRGLPATGFTMNNLDWNILLHEEQGPRVALGLSITIQQLFRHYQIDTGLATEVHRCNNLIVQRPRPLCDCHLHFSKNGRNSYQ